MKKATLCLALVLMVFMNCSYADDQQSSDLSGTGWEIVEDIPYTKENQRSVEPFSARVSLRIKADNAIRAQVESYLGREIRELKDVVVTSIEPDWAIHVIAMKDVTRDGSDIGFTLAVLVINPLNNRAITGTVQNKFDMLGVKPIEYLATVRGHWVMAVSPDGLRDACSKIISTFDSNYLNKDRVIYQTLKDVQEKKNKQNTKRIDLFDEFGVDPNAGDKI